MLDAFDQNIAVRSILDFADKGMSDVDIFGLLGAMPDKPTLVTQDGRILKRPAERAALKSVDISVVFLANGWMSFAWQEKAWRLVKAWPGVSNEICRCIKPTIFELQAGSSLKTRRICFTCDL